MLRNPTSEGHAPLTRLLAVILLCAFGALSAGPLIPLFSWMLSILL